MPAGTAVVSAMPTFWEDVTPSHGLELLASAASATPSVATYQISSLLGSRSYNPTASLPPKLVKRTLDLEFVEMAELYMDGDLTAPNSRPPPNTPGVTNISVWVERFAIMVTRFPDKAPEFLAYMAIIVRVERNYDGDRWAVYDRQFRREALARKDLNWSVTNPCLYSEAFTGRAQCIARCSLGLRDDHMTRTCPRNYEYTVDLLCLDFCRPTPPTSDIASQLQEINTPLVLSEWVRLLSHHPDKAFARYICKGLQEGFTVGSQRGSALQSAHANMLSAQEHPGVIEQYLHEELSHNRMLGHFLPSDGWSS